MDHVSIEITNRIALVTFGRPPVNALDHQSFSELAEAFQSLGAGRDASVAILRAAPGSRVFCGGVDLQDSPRRYRPDGRFEDGGPLVDARFQIDPGRVVRDCFWSIYDCALPVIAAVDGKAIGSAAPTSPRALGAPPLSERAKLRSCSPAVISITLVNH